MAGVGAAAAEEPVVAGLAKGDVVAGAGEHEVGPNAGQDAVGAAIGSDELAGARPDDQLGGCGAEGDDRREVERRAFGWAEVVGDRCVLVGSWLVRQPLRQGEPVLEGLLVELVRRGWPGWEG